MTQSQKKGFKRRREKREKVVVSETRGVKLNITRPFLSPLSFFPPAAQEKKKKAFNNAKKKKGKEKEIEFTCRHVAYFLKGLNI